jgi:hypothetical protein
VVGIGRPSLSAVHDLLGSDAPRSSYARIRSSRRTAEGKSKREIIRCLKRYVAREVYHVLISCGARSSPTGPNDEAHIASGSSAA